MKLLPKLVCTTVILTPLVLSGCQSLFGDSTTYTYPPNAQSHGYHHGHHGRDAATVQTSKATSKATHSTKVVKKRATSGVPLDAPVHNAASSDSSAAASASTQNANSSNAANNNNVVVPPAGPATGLAAPTVQ